MRDTLLPVSEPYIGDLEQAYVAEAMRSGWVSSIGEFVDRFEASFAQLCGTKHCVAVTNGTVALHLALKARDIGPGDEVIVPDLTFAATAAAVAQAGATPVLVDVDEETWCMDPIQVERAIGTRTRAIIPVHLYGNLAPMPALRDLASSCGAFLLEDAAEAHGAQIGGDVVGSLGDAATFSFYGNKLITTGEGGAVTTNDDGLAKRLRFLKDHAMSPERRFFHTEVGFNYRMTNLQAALGCAQIERFRTILEQRQRILAWYEEGLRPMGISANPHRAGTTPVCWLVSIVLPPEVEVAALSQALRAEYKVDTRPFFVPMHEMPPYASCRLFQGQSNVSHDLSNWGLCLPTFHRMTRDDVHYVTESLTALLERRGDP